MSKKIEITGGSDKQNAWATQIVVGWTSLIEREAEVNEARSKTDNSLDFVGFANLLREKAASLPNVMQQQGCQFIIDNRNSGIAKTVINSCRMQALGA